jgi:UDP-glucuronate decarboxylase
VHAAGKRIAETLCMDYHREHKTEVRIMRIFNTYGPRMALDDGRVVSNFVAQVGGHVVDGAVAARLS